MTSRMPLTSIFQFGPSIEASFSVSAFYGDFFAGTSPTDGTILLWLGPLGTLVAIGGNDVVEVTGTIRTLILGSGDDEATIRGEVALVRAGMGADHIVIDGHVDEVRLGRGDDTIEINALGSTINGGRGEDVAIFSSPVGRYDFLVDDSAVIVADRFLGTATTLTHIETFDFAGSTYTVSEIEATFSSDREVPAILVGTGTQYTTVNDPTPTVSVVWDRVVQQAVIQNTGPSGPTVASRAYAMLHTAMFDAYAAYDPDAVRVSFDGPDADNQFFDALAEAAVTPGAVEKAMSFAAFAILTELFPDQEAFFASVMQGRYGYDPSETATLEAAIGRDAAQDLIALRLGDGANQSDSYKGEYSPVNDSPETITDIARWTPEFVPIGTNDRLESFLSPHWGGVEGFALPKNGDGSTDFTDTLPSPPQPFFLRGYESLEIDFDTVEFVLTERLSIPGIGMLDAGDRVPISKDMIGTVINPGFIDQAEEIVAFSANLTDQQKLIAEFWEDAGGTAFPPGTFMSFAQFVSARDDHDTATDAAMFLAISNAVMDAGIATWNAKVEYDYTRPVRAIRELGHLGLIGNWGTDELTGEEGWVVEAFGGFDPATHAGLGTRTILAANFQTYQRPFISSSPPFAEYTSGHSAFSAAGAEVLRLFTGSDHFGGSVTFASGSAQFDPTVPVSPEVLSWDTFSEASEQAGISRLYGGIHFAEGNENGGVLGRTVGEDAYDTVMRFVSGTATDLDRPFYDEFFI